MKTFDTIRTARTRHLCGTGSHACIRIIEPGTRYRHSSLPPGQELGNTGWWHLNECAPCGALYGRPLTTTGGDA